MSHDKPATRRDLARVRKLLAEVGGSLPKEMTERLRALLTTRITQKEVAEIVEDLLRWQRMAAVSSRRIVQSSEELRTKAEELLKGV